MKILYNVCQRLYNKRLMPRKVWFFVYDKLHRKVNDQWGGIKKDRVTGRNK